jgi:hypothetical protein
MSLALELAKVILNLSKDDFCGLVFAKPAQNHSEPVEEGFLASH